MNVFLGKKWKMEICLMAMIYFALCSSTSLVDIDRTCRNLKESLPQNIVTPLSIDMALKLRNQVLAKANLFVDKLKILLAPYGTAMDNKQKANINTFFARVVSKIKQIKYNSHFAQLRLVKLTRDEIEKNFFEYCKTTTQPRLDLAVIGWNRIKHIIGDLPFCISAYIPTVVVTQIAIDNKVETNAVEYVKLQCGELVAKIERGMQTAYDGHDSEVNDRFRKIRDEEIPGKYAELEAFKKLPKTGFGGLFEKYA